MIIQNKAFAAQGEGNQTMGMRIPNTVEDSQDFLLNRVKDYDRLGKQDIKKSMELCEKLYQYEGTCGAAIDVFIEFAITGLQAEDTGKKELDKALDFFNRQVNQGSATTLRGIQQVMNKVSLDWFVKGNSFPYTKWSNIDVPGLTAPYALPMRVVCLNPSLIQIPEETVMLGNAQLYFQPTADMRNLMQGDGRTNPGLKDLKDFKLQGKEDNQYGYRLNSKFVKQIKRKGRDYTAWGIPYLTRSFSAVSSLRRLRRLDDATTEGLVNLITIFKIGDKDFPATSARMSAFSNLIRNPTPTSTLVWPHDVTVEQVGPDGKVLAFEKKYTEPREELLRALGVPAVLIDPSLSKGSDPWVSVLSLSERLEKHRDEISVWLEDLYHQIAVANGYPDIYPKVKWERMHLSNDAEIKNLVMQFYDRGLIDVQTTLEESRYEFDSVAARKKKEKTNGIPELFQPPQLPFGMTPGAKKEGRPDKGGIKDKSSKKTGTKPVVDQKTQKKPEKPKQKAAANNIGVQDDD